MVAALLHLQPTSARSAQCRSRREVPVSFDQLPLCGPQCCSSSLATTALAYKRLRRARKAHYAPPSFPTCRCKLRYFSQSLEPQAKSYRPGRRTRRTCRRAGAGRSHPRRAAQHAGARRRLAMPPHGARGVPGAAAPAARGTAADAGNAGVPEEYVALAHRIADAAAEVTRRYFRCAPAGVNSRANLCTCCLPTPTKAILPPALQPAESPTA